MTCHKIRLNPFPGERHVLIDTWQLTTYWRHLRIYYWKAQLGTCLVMVTIETSFGNVSGTAAVRSRIPRCFSLTLSLVFTSGMCFLICLPIPAEKTQPYLPQIFEDHIIFNQQLVFRIRKSRSLHAAVCPLIEKGTIFYGFIEIPWINP